MTTKQKAFSIIELIAIVTILIILMALIFPAMSKTSDKKERLICTSNLKKISAAFHMFVLENDGYAPFNPNCGELNPSNSSTKGDYFMSWEALYQLGKYMDDPTHEKFYKGEWQTVRCPGNYCELYEGGSDKVWDPPTHKELKATSNRQAPVEWAGSYSVIDNNDRYDAFNICKDKDHRQLVDYQYNVNLGGAFNFNVQSDGKYETRKDYFEGKFGSSRYKVKKVMVIPHQAVVFFDIQWDNLLCYKDGSNEKHDNVFQYCYPTSFDSVRNWGHQLNVIPEADWTLHTDVIVKKHIRTNEKIHRGKGINALFYDGHIEFLHGAAAYNGKYNNKYFDDLMNWGISYPIVDTKSDSKFNEIPGVHGMVRNDEGETSEHYFCIEHEYKKGKDRNTVYCIS